MHGSMWFTFWNNRQRLYGSGGGAYSLRTKENIYGYTAKMASMYCRARFFEMEPIATAVTFEDTFNRHMFRILYTDQVVACIRAAPRTITDSQYITVGKTLCDAISVLPGGEEMRDYLAKL